MTVVATAGADAKKRGFGPSPFFIKERPRNK